MNLSLNRNFLLLIPLVMVVTLYYVGTNIDLFEVEYLGPAVLFDLFITSPLIYFLIIRKNKQIPNTTVVPFMIVNLALANWLFPESMKQNLDILTYYIFPVLELGLISVIIWKVRQTIIAFRQNKDGKTDFYDILKEATLSIVPTKRLAPLVASEIAMIYYALFAWRRNQDEEAFTHHKENGSLAIFWVVLLIVGAETIPVHLLASMWSSVLAWVLTITSLYFFIQILGHIKALGIRKSEIINNNIVLRNGIFSDVVIPIDNINIVESTASTPEVDNKKIMRQGMLGEAESHNIAIHLNQSQTLNLPYGMKKEFDILLLQIDQKQAFINKVEKISKLL